MITNHTTETLRDFEEDIAAEFNAGRIRAPIHLSGGNEDHLLRIFEDVHEQDWIAATWRSHYVCLLKGVPPERLKADILAGKSITLCYPEYRIVSSAIVGGVLPIAVGIAWAIRRAGGSEVVWIFCGDMTAETGVYHECMKYCTGHRLPVRFVVEDNGLSVCTSTEETWGHTLGAISHRRYEYALSWPHSGAGQRIEF